MAKADPRPTLLIVEDESKLAIAIARGLGALAQVAPAVAGSAIEARDVVSRCDDLIGAIVDIMLPDGSGLDFVAWLGARWPGLPVLVLTAHCEPQLANRTQALRAGYCCKPVELQTLVDFTLRAVESRRSFAERIRGAAVQWARRVELSPRQTEVLLAACKDERRNAIALETLMSVHTVKRHVASILEKSGLDDLHQVVARLRMAALEA